jgi:hypothetical protein
MLLCLAYRLRIRVISLVDSEKKHILPCSIADRRKYGVGTADRPKKAQSAKQNPNIG